MNNGFYIVLEGAQGTGKTTQIDILAKRLREEGYPVRLFREPDSQTDLTAQAIRRLTQDPHYPMNTKTEVMLYNAARSQSLDIIKKAKQNGVICICDRNYLTTLAIQYYGRGDLPDYNAINSIVDFAVADMQPDVTIILDAPAEELAKRTKQRGLGERFDMLDLEFLERVRAGYLLEAKARSYPVLLATESPQVIHEKIWQFLHGQPIQSITVTASTAVSSAGQATNKFEHAENDQSPIKQFINKKVSCLLGAKVGQVYPKITSKMLSASSDQNNYFIPANLNQKTKKVYTLTMDKIFNKYSEILQKTIQYLDDGSKNTKKQNSKTKAIAYETAKTILPMCTFATITFPLTKPVINNVMADLLADELPEAQKIAKEITSESGDLAFSKLKNNTAYTVTKHAKLKKLANKHLPKNYASSSENVNLLDVWPRNELDIVADMLYEHSDMPLKAIKKEVGNLSYKQKEEIFKAYMGERLNRRQNPGKVLEKVIYNWDIFCEYEVFKNLMRYRIVSDMEWQYLTPRYGYDIPELIEKAGLAEQFIDCFDLSLELYSQMQKAGYELEAQYAVLHGHFMRWKVTTNAREAFHMFELRTSLQGHPNYHRIAKQMHEKVLEVHPLIGESMIFVNKGEGPELTRLAAERYTQYKLKQQKKKKKKRK